VFGESSLPQSREKTPPITELPNPELNPLLNPTLGRNLGRWAEVYFTSPPDKREEAVVELLRELKASPPSEEISENPPSAESRFVTTEITRPENPIPDPSTKCVECGHTYAIAQRFCGMCGAPMGTEHSGYRAAELPPPQEFVFPQSSIFGATIPASSSNQPSLEDGLDISWLREKNLAGDGEESSFRRFSKFATAAVAIAAIGLLIYAQSRPADPVSKAKTPAATPQQAVKTPENQPAEPASRTATATPKPTQEPPDPLQDTASQSHSQPQATPQQQAQPEPPQPAATQPATATAPLPANTPSGQIAKPSPQLESSDSTAGNGSQELALAEDYLNGKRGPRDSAEAAKFLWKAVGKENPSAILLLSDMYLVGDGVPKSCDQARLLLNAAVRKNVPLAAQKLHNLLNSGCP
jgi:hypothetical protein